MVDYRQRRTVEVWVSSPQKSRSGVQRPVVQRFVQVHSSRHRWSLTGPASGSSIASDWQLLLHEKPASVGGEQT